MSPREWLVLAFLFGAVCGLLLARAAEPVHTPPPKLRLWRRGDVEMLSAHSPGEGWTADPKPLLTPTPSAIFAALRAGAMTESHVEQISFGTAMQLLQLHRARLQLSGLTLIWLEAAPGETVRRMEYRGANEDAQLFGYAVRCIAARLEAIARQAGHAGGVKP